MKLSALALALKRLNISRVAYAATEWNALNRKATSWFQQGKYTKAAMAATKAVQAAEEALGLNHPDVATRLNNLAYSYSEQGKYAKAEPLFQRALAIQETALGLNHPDVATSLKNIAVLHRKTGRANSAERLADRAAKIRMARR